jgi:hypothetical protein
MKMMRALAPEKGNKMKSFASTLAALALFSLAMFGCSSTQEKGAEAAAAEAAPAEAAPAEAAAAEVTAAEPDKEKFLKHAKEHIKYPANRAAILEACANTPEFSAGEKKWVADNLAEGDYADADALIKALEWAE